MSERSETPRALIDVEARTFDRDISWLAFARRVLALAESEELPLLERIKFAGIIGMLHDEFFMKRMASLKRRMARGGRSASRATTTYHSCRAEVFEQIRIISRVLERELRPALAEQEMPIVDVKALGESERAHLRELFRTSILPILTPLAVDAEHPFPFISNLTLNLAVLLPDEEGGPHRFARVKVPDNRPRWVRLPKSRRFVPLEQVIANNLDLMFPGTPPVGVYLFRVTRGAEGEQEMTPEAVSEDAFSEPGSIVRIVSHELKARRFAGPVRLQVDAAMPEELQHWLIRQLGLNEDEIYPADYFLGLADLSKFDPEAGDELRLPAHAPVTHPRLVGHSEREPEALFEEMRRGDILVHHPYHSFDTSVLRFLQAAAIDPKVLAIKLTIYRTSRDSPIVRALAEASRRGKQVAVLVEITARFDEAPNIAWGQILENEGVHVAYGVERLKTHVKLALVVREEEGGLRSYLHVGTGNYHTGTARIYEDLGLLTTDPLLCADAATVFNALTGATTRTRYERLLVAPATMRPRFLELIRRETEHARAGRPARIRAKMNQLQDAELIEALYDASAAGVPITLTVRGLNCLRPGVEGLSENIRLFSVVGRFLEHSRIYAFENGGDPQYFIGSADWMTRNLDRRVETITPVGDPELKRELDEILQTYEADNHSAWDCDAEGTYHRRRPAEGEPRRDAQETFIERARERRRQRSRDAPEG